MSSGDVSTAAADIMEQVKALDERRQALAKEAGDLRKAVADACEKLKAWIRVLEPAAYFGSSTLADLLMFALAASAKREASAEASAACVQLRAWIESMKPQHDSSKMTIEELVLFARGAEHERLGSVVRAKDNLEKKLAEAEKATHAHRCNSGCMPCSDAYLESRAATMRRLGVLEYDGIKLDPLGDEDSLRSKLLARVAILRDMEKDLCEKLEKAQDGMQRHALASMLTGVRNALSVFDPGGMAVSWMKREEKATC